MKKKLVLAAVLILAVAAVFFGSSLLRLCPPWLWGEFPLTYGDLEPMAWTDAPVSEPAGADQVYVLQSKASGPLNQREISFRDQVEDLLNGYRYQALSLTQGAPASDPPEWRGGDEIFFLDGSAQCRLCYDGTLWVPTEQGWQGYLPHNPDRFRQDLLELQTEYHNDASLYSYPNSASAR